MPSSFVSPEPTNLRRCGYVPSKLRGNRYQWRDGDNTAPAPLTHCTAAETTFWAPLVAWIGRPHAKRQADHSQGIPVGSEATEDPSLQVTLLAYLCRLRHPVWSHAGEQCRRRKRHLGPALPHRGEIGPSSMFIPSPLAQQARHSLLFKLMHPLPAAAELSCKLPQGKRDISKIARLYDQLLRVRQGREALRGQRLKLTSEVVHRPPVPQLVGTG